ncbi:MAG: DnaJ domain-containing protein [Mariniblastus sp.]
MKKEFVNYYEILEVSQQASSETIERVFRHLAQLSHPDHSDEPDMKRFTSIVEAYDTLKDADRRAEYDIEYNNHMQQNEDLIKESGCLDEDSANRHKMLSLFYAKRRKSMKDPGMGPTSLEELMGCTEDVINFYLWYFRSKNWIDREENGMLAITAEGVDRIEATLEKRLTEGMKRITMENDRLESSEARQMAQ